MSKHIRFLVVVPMLLVMLFSISAFRVHSTAHAASLDKSPKCTCVNGYFTVSNTRYTGTTTTDEIRLALGPGTSGSISKTIGWSNSFSANASGGGSVDNQTVSAGVGFNVTSSGSTTITCSANNTNSHDITLAFQDVYDNYEFDIYWHYVGTTSFQGNGFASNFDHNRCAIE